MKPGGPMAAVAQTRPLRSRPPKKQDRQAFEEVAMLLRHGGPDEGRGHFRLCARYLCAALHGQFARVKAGLQICHDGPDRSDEFGDGRGRHAHETGQGFDTGKPGADAGVGCKIDATLGRMGDVAVGGHIGDGGMIGRRASRARRDALP